MNMIYIPLDPRFDIEQLGYLPLFLNDDDPRPAREQFDANYISGWNPMKGWHFNPRTLELTYPEDPPLKPIAFTALNEDVVFFYPYAQVMILHKDATFEVARLD